MGVIIIKVKSGASEIEIQIPTKDGVSNNMLEGHRALGTIARLKEIVEQIKILENEG